MFQAIKKRYQNMMKRAQGSTEVVAEEKQVVPVIVEGEVTNVTLLFNETETGELLVTHNGNLTSITAVTAQKGHGTFATILNIAVFYHSPGTNGNKLIIEHLQKFHKIRHIDCVEFSDSGREINKDLCTFLSLFNAAEVRLTKDNVTEKELIYIQSKFLRLQRIEIHKTVSDDCARFSLEFKETKLHDGSNLHVKEILHMRCKCLEVENANFMTSHMNALVQFWINADEKPKFHSLVIRRVEDDKNIFAGLTTFKWTHNRRGRYFLQDSKTVFDCANCLDVQREDGTFATVVYSLNVFRFFVWNDKYPRIPVDGVQYIDSSTLKSGLARL